MKMYFYHAVLVVDNEDKEIHGIIRKENPIAAYQFICDKLEKLTGNTDGYQIRAFNNVE